MAGWPWCRSQACPLGPRPCINSPSPTLCPWTPSEHSHPAYCHTSPVRTGGVPPGQLVQAPQCGEEKLRPGRDEAAPSPCSCVFQSHTRTTMGTKSSPPKGTGAPPGLPPPLQGPEPGQGTDGPVPLLSSCTQARGLQVCSLQVLGDLGRQGKRGECPHPARQLAPAPPCTPQTSKPLLDRMPPRGMAWPEATPQVRWPGSLFSLASLRGQLSPGAESGRRQVPGKPLVDKSFNTHRGH